MKRVVLFVFCAFFVLACFSRSVQITSGVLTVNDGLSNNTVYNIHKDRSGFIWLGTDVGLSKYDGYHFTNYQLRGLPFSVRRIVEIDSNLFCLLGINGSIMCFDPEQEKVLQVESPSVPLSDAVFTDLYYVGKKRICALDKRRLLCLEIERQEDKIIFSSSSIEKNLEARNWAQISRDDKNRLFALSEDYKSLYCFNFESNAASTYDISELLDSYDLSNIAAIYIHDDCLWLQKRWQGVICYNLKNRTHRQINLSGVNFDVRRIVSLGLNSYGLITWNGVFEIRFENTPAQGQYELIHFSDGADAKIKNAFISATFDEKENVLWVATFGGGLVKYMLDNVLFNWIDLPQDIEVSQVIEDDNGYIWLSSIKHGLMKSDSNVVSENLKFSSWNKLESFSGKCALYKDRRGFIWLGDEHADILCIDPKTDRYTRYRVRLKEDENFTARIYDFCLSTEGRLWIGTSKGLIAFDIEKKQFEWVKDEKLRGKMVHVLKEELGGDIWLGTQNGLVRMVTEEKDGPRFVDGYEEAVGLEPSLVYSIFINSNNQTMVGYAGKLLRIDNAHKDKVRNTFVLAHNLPNGHIYCTAEDRGGNLWFGTNSGIMTMKVGSDLIYTYSVIGNNMAVSTLKDGSLFWIALDKLLYFDPAKIKDSFEVHPFVFSRLSVDNKIVKAGEECNGQVILPISINLMNELTLEHGNKDFTLFLTDLQYKVVGQKIFYRMLPDNDKWTVMDVREGLTFAGLGVGEHILQVQAVTYDGNKGEIEEFTIHILPHWSVAWWAWSIYCLILALVVYLVLRFMRYRVSLYEQKYMAEEKLKNELYRTELKHKQERESARVRNKFYGLLTNELRTPLTMIINPLREILNVKTLSGSLKRDIEIAYYNSIGLKDICTQLTNMYRMETDYEYLQVAKWDVYDILDDIIRKQRETLNAYHIDFRYDLPEKGTMELWGDRDMLEFVIRILLSNAYRHVAYSGRVELYVSVERSEEEEFYIVSVSDNGKWKVEENIENFLQQANSNEDNIDFSRLELGFDLLERIVAQHHGELEFKSKEGEDTQVFMKLKSGVAHFSNDSKVVFVQSVTDEKVINDSLSLPEMNTWNWDEEEESGIAAEDERKKLLVVDDNQAFRLYLKITFADEYKVLEAENGQIGVDIALEEQPDVILCDVMMPVKSGFDCCRELKGNLRTCHIPILFLTARGMEEDIIDGMEMGADDYLQKPVNIDLLRAKVAAIIKNRENLKQTYMKQLVTVRTQEDEKNVLPDIDDPFIKRVIELIEDHMQDVDFSVTGLAKLMNMSQPTLYRKVKQSTGFNIVEFIRGVRLRKAVELLEQGGYSIQEVIEMVGYNDQASFRKHFMKLFKMTPSAYMKQHKG